MNSFDGHLGKSVQQRKLSTGSDSTTKLWDLKGKALMTFKGD